jgi:ABC-2 type transport system ATP-binding protein
MRGEALEISALTKSYGGRRVLDDVTLDVDPGEICGLLGPNGAGKTTLVSIISGLRIADSGSVRIGGHDVADGGRATRGLVGLAGQETGIYPTVTVLDNLLFFAGLAGLGRRERQERIDELADVFDLSQLLGRLGRNLSGGEKRRLHTAMALVHRPAVLLLDEPTTGVDVGSRSRLLDAVRRLAREDGCTIVYSTHYLPEIEELDASVAILDRGVIVTRGALAELIGRYGQGSVSITFDGPAPAAGGAVITGAVVNGDVLTKTTEAGGVALAEIISHLGPDAARVRSVEMTQPNLESVFKTLTGRRFSVDDEPEVSS